MNTQSTRVTREEAARLAGVSTRTINRWSAAGLLSVERDPLFRSPATYDPAELDAAKAAWSRRGRRGSDGTPLPETDISG